MPPQIIYLARGRPQRPRANLIQTLHTVEALGQAGASVRLYVPPLPPGFDTRGFLAGMGIHTPVDLRGSMLLHSNWGGWPFVLAHRGALRRAEAVYTRVPDFSRLLARWGIPHFLEVHDTAELLAGDGARWLRAACEAGRLRGLTVISAAGKAALTEAGLPAARIEVLHSGVDLAAFAAAPALQADDLATPHALYVGRISRDRGLDVLAAVAGAGHAVTLVGPADDPVPALPTLARQPAIPHAQVPTALAGGAIALMPYQADLQHAATISPIKLFEAMAAGRVVIASDLPTLREVVRPGENGLLVPPDDPQAWIAALEQVRADPQAALRMAAQARHDAAGYSWSARAHTLLAFIQRCGAQP
jgi:glycosyltransferase involved in cell wall biosynthesis